MHTFKRAAIIGGTVLAGIVGTAGVSSAAWYNDNDTRQDTQDCEAWVVYSATEVSPENIYYRQGGAAEAWEEAPEICYYHDLNGLDTTDITWKEYVANLRFVAY
jgi:hypothetical protein